MISGATGRIGKRLLSILIADGYYDKVIAVVRRPTGIIESKYEEIIVPNFDEIEKYKKNLVANHHYCCLGARVNLRSSKGLFRKIVLGYTMKLATLAMQSPRFESFSTITALETNPESPLTYNSAKGELEQELKALNMKKLFIFQPSILHGDGSKKVWANYLIQYLNAFLSFFIIGNIPDLLNRLSYTQLALAMFRYSTSENITGTQILRPLEISKILKH